MDEDSDMRVVVTGAAGFIGSWLSQRLLALGHRVIGIDCLTDYYSTDLKRKNIEEALDHPRYEFLEQDILEADLPRILGGCEVIFHQAAQAGVRASWGQRFETYTRNNVLATQRLLEASKELSLKRFVFASSSSVYGDAESLPVSEDTSARPISPYGVTKLAAENLCHLYHRSFGVPTVSLRYFTVFGPRQRPDMAFHRFLRAIMRGEEIAIYGAGDQTRDLTYVADAVDANLLAMEKGSNGSIYNIGCGSRISINEAIELIEGIIGRKANRKHSESQKGDMLHTWSDTTLARKDLGFRPRYGFEEGLREEVEWLKGVLD